MEEYTLDIKYIDLNDFEFDEIILRDAMVLNTLVTYFKEGIFGKTDLKKNLYHHFRSYAERSKVRKARKLGGGSNGELMAYHLIEVSLYLLVCFCW